MSAEDATASVQSETVIALLLSQVEELKRDKDDLRADKEALKQENARLACELQKLMEREEVSSHAVQSASTLATSTKNEAGGSAETALLPEKVRVVPFPARIASCAELIR